MPLTTESMRVILLICLLGMSLQATFYLRSRKMSFEAYLRWGLLAILVPILGPFLVVLTQPGELHRH